jgi:hypothetical protein
MRSTDIQSLIIFLALFIIAISCFANEAKISMIVKYPGVQQLNAETKQSLYEIAVDLLKTSNFNSFNHAKLLQSTIPGVQERYRKTTCSHYLLISVGSEQDFKTVGGDVRVVEIVIGLNASEYADALFTIDPEGRIIEHAKYSGSKAIELLEAVKQAAAGR